MPETCYIIQYVKVPAKYLFAYFIYLAFKRNCIQWEWKQVQNKIAAEKAKADLT